MNYKQLIEQKARDYANSQFKKGYVEGKPNFTCVDLDFAYRAGAEAAIEIVNTWIPAEKKPTPTNPILIKDKDAYIYVGCYLSESCIGSGFFYNERGVDIKIDAVEWKPITL